MLACLAPTVLVILMTAKGPVLSPVPPEALKKELRDSFPSLHAECRKRKLGDCLGQMVLNPANGHIRYLCSKLPVAEENGSTKTEG